MRQIKKQIKEENDKLSEEVKIIVEKIGEDEAEQMVVEKLRDSAIEILNIIYFAKRKNNFLFLYSVG